MSRKSQRRSHDYERFASYGQYDWGEFLHAELDYLAGGEKPELEAALQTAIRAGRGITALGIKAIGEARHYKMPKGLPKLTVAQTELARHGGIAELNRAMDEVELKADFNLAAIVSGVAARR